MNMNTLTIFWTDACITFVLFGSIECIQLFQNCSKVPFCSGAGCTMWWYIVLISYGESELHQEVFIKLSGGGIALLVKKNQEKRTYVSTALLDKHRVAFWEQPLSFCSVRHLMSDIDIWKFSVCGRMSVNNAARDWVWHLAATAASPRAPAVWSQTINSAEIDW